MAAVFFLEISLIFFLKPEKNHKLVVHLSSWKFRDIGINSSHTQPNLLYFVLKTCFNSIFKILPSVFFTKDSVFNLKILIGWGNFRTTFELLSDLICDFYSLIIYDYFRSHHPSHLHQKCILSPTPPTQSSFTWLGWRSASTGSWTWILDLLPSCLYPSPAHSANQISPLPGSGIRMLKVSYILKQGQKLSIRTQVKVAIR